MKLALLPCSTTPSWYLIGFHFTYIEKSFSICRYYRFSSKCLVFNERKYAFVSLCPLVIWSPIHSTNWLYIYMHDNIVQRVTYGCPFDRKERGNFIFLGESRVNRFQINTTCLWDFARVHSPFDQAFILLLQSCRWHKAPLRPPK